MKRLVFSGLLFFSLIAVLAAPAAPQLAQEYIPATSEIADVGEAGPQLVSGERTLSTSEFVAVVAQDAAITWSQLFEASGRSFVPPTIVLVGPGAYARSGCGINVGDPRDHAHHTPALYCQYGGETGEQPLDATEVIVSAYRFGPVLYLSLPWLEDYAAGSGVAPDVALAYRVVREYAHHVEYLLGVTDHTGGGCCDYSDQQVALVAECFAGVWAHSAYDRGRLDLEDIAAAQSAAWGEDAVPVILFGRDAAYGDAQQQLDAYTTGYDNGHPGHCLG